MTVRPTHADLAGPPGLGRASAHAWSLPEQLNLKSLRQPGLESSHRPPALPDELVVQRWIVVQPHQVRRSTNIDVGPQRTSVREQLRGLLH